MPIPEEHQWSHNLFISSALPVAARGSKGLIFEDGPGFESAFKLFHGQDGIVPLSGRSYVPDENRSEITDVNPEPALPFNPFAARAATISLSAFGPFGFNFYNGKGKKQNKKPNNLDQSHKKPNKPDQNSMKIVNKDEFDHVYKLLDYILKKR
uniref:Uncharacterized protein n=1 Tax=Aegilops tauschii subsp. strangulata TaxID=200361 RepID=A0A453LRS5_AEGTS